MSRKTRDFIRDNEVVVNGDMWFDKNNKCNRKHDMPFFVKPTLVAFKKKYHLCGFDGTDFSKCICPVYHFKNKYLYSLPTYFYFNKEPTTCSVGWGEFNNDSLLHVPILNKPSIPLLRFIGETGLSSHYGYLTRPKHILENGETFGN